MVRGLNPGLCICAVILLFMSGCATTPVGTEQIESMPNEAEVAAVSPQPAKELPPSKTQAKPSGKNFSTVRRAITEKEVRKLADKDPDLEFYHCIEILCRLNKKDKEYVRQDMKKKRPLIVPKNFTSFKDWSPLPGDIASAKKFPKLILIVKDIQFLGWYQNGRLVRDTYVCIGKMHNWTKKGMYTINEKDLNHMSTYPNAYGEPAIMPDALHVYERVWIHAGDVIGPNCSHGCINVPIAYSENLYDWADVGTTVLITESLKDLDRDIKTAPLANRHQKAPPAKEKAKTENGRQKAQDGIPHRPVGETPNRYSGNGNQAITGGI